MGSAIRDVIESPLSTFVTKGGAISESVLATDFPPRLTKPVRSLILGVSLILEIKIKKSKFRKFKNVVFPKNQLPRFRYRRCGDA